MNRLIKKAEGENYKLFYDYEYNEAKKMADEKGWKIIFLMESSGANGDSYAVYKDADSIELNWLREAVKNAEEIQEKNLKNRYKKADAEFTYIATAPIKFTTSTSMDSWEDDGKDYFNELQDAVKSEMAEIGTDGLAQYIDLRSEIYDVVKSIIVDVAISGNKVVSKTTIKTNEELNDNDIKELKDYITGQFSDGWGEGFEQRPIAEWKDTEYEEIEVEEEDGTWGTEQEPYEENFELCASFWDHKNWSLEIKKV